MLIYPYFIIVLPNLLFRLAFCSSFSDLYNKISYFVGFFLGFKNSANVSAENMLFSPILILISRK